VTSRVTGDEMLTEVANFHNIVSGSDDASSDILNFSGKGAMLGQRFRGHLGPTNVS